MDGKTPCIAEAARRLLRTDDCSLRVPESYVEQANEIALMISDLMPSILREPTIRVGNDQSIIINCPAGVLAQIGGSEPNHSICWIPDHGGQLSILWSRFTDDVRDLVSAGYPGCVGCGGPGSEGPWDETASRAHAGAMLGGT
ncbi:MAG: hypothetical protein QGF94_01165 [Candidatus Thalassarchaeaceae archaeon]|nr:hypothetical protein [Candidatus Thalassarchaeaceae archaeon]